MAAPIERVAKWLVHAFRGVPANEAAPCDYCRTTVAAFDGIRDGHVFCSEDCLQDHMAARIG